MYVSLQILNVFLMICQNTNTANAGVYSTPAEKELIKQAGCGVYGDLLENSNCLKLEITRFH